jgi:hypothetical protein
MFRVTARRNKLFGLSVAARLGLPNGEEAKAYAKSVVAADFEARATPMSSRRCGPTSRKRASPLPR